MHPPSSAITISPGEKLMTPTCREFNSALNGANHLPLSATGGKILGSKQNQLQNFRSSTFSKFSSWVSIQSKLDWLTAFKLVRSSKLEKLERHLSRKRGSRKNWNGQRIGWKSIGEKIPWIVSLNLVEPRNLVEKFEWSSRRARIRWRSVPKSFMFDARTIEAS